MGRPHPARSRWCSISSATPSNLRRKGRSAWRSPCSATQVTVTVGDTGHRHTRRRTGSRSSPSFAAPNAASRRGYRGLGLGLAICKRLIELHGGAIGVSSAGIEGAGSAFSFTLPTIPAPAGAELGGRSRAQPSPAAGGLPYDQPPPLPGTQPQRTILVVDDDPETLDLHARMVQAHPPANRCSRPTTAATALAILARVHVDLVLLDLTMPELDGFGGPRRRCAKRRRCATSPVIVVTGQDAQRSRDGAPQPRRDGGDGEGAL